MSATTKTKTKKNMEKPRKDDMKVKSNSSTLAEDSNQDPITSLQIGLEGISKQIFTMKNELKADLKMFKEAITGQMRNELSEFKEDIDQKLAIVTKSDAQVRKHVSLIMHVCPSFPHPRCIPSWFPSCFVSEGGVRM